VTRRLALTIGGLALAVLWLAGCASQRTPTTTPTMPAKTSPPPVVCQVPRASAPVIDGVLSPGEWDGAAEESLTGGGQLWLMHDGEALYIALRGKPDSLGSLCVSQGEEVRILHASFSLGTAAFERQEDTWRRVRTFIWTRWEAAGAEAAAEQRSAFLREEGWLANTTDVGAAGEMEFALRMDGGSTRLALAYFFGMGSDQTIEHWPPGLGDACLNTYLMQGRPSTFLGFQPQTWALVELAGTQ